MHPMSVHVLTANLYEGTVRLSFRFGLADGITVFSRRGWETDFPVIAEDEPAPVVDARPKLDPHRPEIRRYRAGPPLQQPRKLPAQQRNRARHSVGQPLFPECAQIPMDNVLP